MRYGRPSIYQPPDFKRAWINLDDRPQGQPYFRLGKSKKNNQWGLFQEIYGLYTLEETAQLLNGRTDVAVIDVLRKHYTNLLFPQRFCYSQRGDQQIVTAHVDEEKRGISGELIVSQNADLSEPNRNYQVIHVPTLEDVVATHLSRLTGEEKPITPEMAQEEYEHLFQEVNFYRPNYIRGIIS